MKQRLQPLCRAAKHPQYRRMWPRLAVERLQAMVSECSVYPLDGFAHLWQVHAQTVVQKLEGAPRYGRKQRFGITPVRMLMA